MTIVKVVSSAYVKAKGQGWWLQAEHPYDSSRDRVYRAVQNEQRFRTGDQLLDLFVQTAIESGSQLLFAQLAASA